MAKKSDNTTKRSTFIQIQALRWMEKNQEEVMEAIRNLADKRYPRTGKARKRMELDPEVANLKGEI